MMLKSRLLWAVRIVAVVGTIVGVLAAQTPARLAFEVASLKERSNVPLGMVGIQRFPGRLVDACGTLNSLVFYAYSRTWSSPISGLPDWASTPCSDTSR